MLRSALLLGVPACFTLLVLWFAGATLQATPPLAAASLRGAALTSVAAIEQLVTADATLQALSRYQTQDIAFFALVDRDGRYRFHTNPALIGETAPELPRAASGPGGLDERRLRLGTGEEVYLLSSRIHPGRLDYRLLLALHTWRADRIVERARTSIAIVSALTVALWGATAALFWLLRRQERQQRQHQRREELARLGEMSAVMAHEIRNPLAGIKGFAQLVERAGDLAQARQHADRIVAQSLRLEALVDDLLAFARDDGGERRMADLAALAGECHALLAPEAVAQGVTFAFAPGEPVMAKVAANRIRQLIINLLKNALQAMPDGGRLELSVAARDGLAMIRVDDSGSGIPPQDLEQIFTPFWTSKVHGTGLGLALCRKVAEEHGGRLTVESRTGAGSTFTLTFPAQG